MKKGIITAIGAVVVVTLIVIVSLIFLSGNEELGSESNSSSLSETSSVSAEDSISQEVESDALSDSEKNNPETLFRRTMQQRLFQHINDLREENNKISFLYDSGLQKYVDETVSKSAYKMIVHSDEYNSVMIRFPGYIPTEDLLSGFSFDMYVNSDAKYMSVSCYYGKQQDKTYIMITLSDSAFEDAQKENKENENIEEKAKGHDYG